MVLMVKEPHPGRVKTRLGRDIGIVHAAWWFRHQALGTIRRLRDPRWDIVLAVSPDHEGQLSRVWPADLIKIPQGHGDLGARMTRVLRASAPHPTCVIGADIPGLRKCHIRQAFAGLGSHSGVIGPATDGGYWLIGMRHPAQQPSGFLTSVRWSTRWAREDTLNSAKDMNWAELETLSDVDDLTDLRRLSGRG